MIYSTSLFSRASLRNNRTSCNSSSKERVASRIKSSAATLRHGKRSRLTEPLSIDVTYDRTRLAQDDIATEKVTIRNNLKKTANMIMVDLGIPPGFDLLSEDLQAFKEKSSGTMSGRLEKFSLDRDAGHPLLRWAFVRNKRSRSLFVCAPNIRSAPTPSNPGSTSITIRHRTRRRAPFNWR